MDSKRPDIDLEEKPDEEGLVTKRDRDGDEDERSLLGALRHLLGR